MIRAAVVAALVASSAASAQVEHRGQAWWLAFAQGKLSPVARAYFELQPRVGGSPFQADSLLLRAALGAELFEGFTLWQGFAWVPAWASADFDSFNANEGRLYQQIQYVRSFGTVGLQLRFRQEERWLAAAGGPLFRARLMVRLTWRFADAPRLLLAVQDEPMVNFNERPGSSPRGFDQNRAYVGIGWQPTPSLLIELGYLQQLVRRADRPFRLGHTALLTTAYTF